MKNALLPIIILASSTTHCVIARNATNEYSSDEYTYRNKYDEYTRYGNDEYTKDRKEEYDEYSTNFILGMQYDMQGEYDYEYETHLNEYELAETYEEFEQEFDAIYHELMQSMRSMPDDQDEVTQEVLTNFANVVGNFIAMFQDKNNPKHVGVCLQNMLTSMINIGVTTMKDMPLYEESVTSEHIISQQSLVLPSGVQQELTSIVVRALR